MKNVIIVAFLFIGALAKAQTGNIKVTIPSLKESKGQVILNLYNKEDSFLEDEKQFKKASFSAKQTGGIFSFANIPEGDYVIIAYWDINGNGELDTNFIGIPKEEVGFSNNVSGSFGAPKFKDASFKVSKDSTAEMVIIINTPSHF